MTHCWGISGDNLMTHFQCEVCHFSNLHVRNTMSHRMADDMLLCAIRQASLNIFCSWRPGTVKNNLMMLKRIHEVGDKFLGLMERLPYMVPLPSRDEIVMGVTCSTLILSKIKREYAGPLQWYIMIKFTTTCSDLYEVV